MVYMYHNFLIHLSADGHLGCFPCPNYCKQCCDEHWGTRVSLNSGFLVCMPSSGIAGSYGSVFVYDVLKGFDNLCARGLNCILFFGPFVISS